MKVLLSATNPTILIINTSTTLKQQLPQDLLFFTNFTKHFLQNDRCSGCRRPQGYYQTTPTPLRRPRSTPARFSRTSSTVVRSLVLRTTRTRTLAMLQVVSRLP